MYSSTARILSSYEYTNYLLVVQVFVRPPSLARTFSYYKDRFFPSPAEVTLATVTAYPPPRKSHEEHHPLAMRRAHWRHHLVEGIRGLLRATPFCKGVPGRQPRDTARAVRRGSRPSQVRSRKAYNALAAAWLNVQQSARQDSTGMRPSCPFDLFWNPACIAALGAGAVARVCAQRRGDRAGAHDRVSPDSRLL